MPDNFKNDPIDLLSDYSLEMTAKDCDGLVEAASAIPPGTQISVTFLPGEHVDARIAAAATAKRLGLVPAPHISARRISSERELDDFVGRLSAEVGVDRVFVVAGDLADPAGPYADALAVIKSGVLARHGVQTVGISGHPEGHPEISRERLWSALMEKRAALQDLGQRFEIVTQFGFDADPILDWVEQVRALGIEEPIRIGVPGPASVKTLLRFATRCGVGASAKVMAKYGVSITKLVNTAGPDRLIAAIGARFDPAAHGDVRLHLYPFGGFPRTAEWARNYRAR